MIVRPPSLENDELETARLRLRQWRIADWDALHRAYGDPEVMRWHGRPEGLSLAETAYSIGRMSAQWEERGYGMWAAEERDDGTLVGRIGLLYHPDSPAGDDRVEIAWSLQQDRWGRGYATEGALASLEHGFERVGLERIVSIAVTANTRSIRVMERIGLERVGRTHWRGSDVTWYGLDRAEWRRRRDGDTA